MTPEVIYGLGVIRPELPSVASIPRLPRVQDHEMINGTNEDAPEESKRQPAIEPFGT